MIFRKCIFLNNNNNKPRRHSKAIKMSTIVFLIHGQYYLVFYDTQWSVYTKLLNTYHFPIQVCIAFISFIFTFCFLLFSIFFIFFLFEPFCFESNFHLLWFSITTLRNWNLNQSWLAHTCFPAPRTRRLHNYIASTFDWLTWLSLPSVTAQNNLCGFGFMARNWKSLYKCIHELIINFLWSPVSHHNLFSGFGLTSFNIHLPRNLDNMT